MAGVGAILDAVFGSYDLKVTRQWRDEDVRYREQEKQWREDAILREITWRHEDIEREQRLFKLANEKRMIDARQRQLIAVIKLATVLGGFNMAAIVEINVPEHFNQTIMAIYAGIAALQVFDDTIYGMWYKAHTFNCLVSVHVHMHSDLYFVADGDNAICDSHVGDGNKITRNSGFGFGITLQHVLAHAMRK